MLAGVSAKVMGRDGMNMTPSLALSMVFQKPTALRCGSSFRSSRLLTRAMGNAVPANRSSQAWVVFVLMMRPISL